MLSSICKMCFAFGFLRRQHAQQFMHILLMILNLKEYVKIFNFNESFINKLDCLIKKKRRKELRNWEASKSVRRLACREHFKQFCLLLKWMKLTMIFFQFAFSTYRTKHRRIPWTINVNTKNDMAHNMPVIMLAIFTR